MVAGPGDSAGRHQDPQVSPRRSQCGHATQRW